MSKNKLAKFEDNTTFENLLQKPEPMAGKWSNFFKNDNPIVLELACGHGAYTVGLSEMYPNINFIGIDIKGARMWRGAKYALENSLNNAAFLRIHIDHVLLHFDKNEVSGIWITFPDPQKEKHRKKLTHPLFLNRYKQILKKDGMITLKTDDEHLYEWSLNCFETENVKVIYANDDIYNLTNTKPEWHIKTFYESMWLKQGKLIKIIEFGF